MSTKSRKKQRRTLDEHAHDGKGFNKLLTALALFTVTSCFSTILIVLVNHQDLLQGSISNFKIPTTVGDAKKLSALILKHKDNHLYSVFGAYFATYILLQSFCIPGSLVLSILAGYLFPLPIALFIICTCSTLGASTFYIIVHSFFKKQVERLLGSRIKTFNNQIQLLIKQNNSSILICVILLRATPIVPNWMINLCSPIVNLPFKPFVQGTFLGVAPLSVIHVWTGRVLNDLSNDASLISVQSILITSLVGLICVLLMYTSWRAKKSIAGHK